MISTFYDLNKVSKGPGALLSNLFCIRIGCLWFSLSDNCMRSSESSYLAIFWFQQISGSLPLSDALVLIIIDVFVF